MPSALCVITSILAQSITFILHWAGAVSPISPPAPASFTWEVHIGNGFCVGLDIGLSGLHHFFVDTRNPFF